MRKLRILAASDVHGDSDTTTKLAMRAEKEKVDLVVLCGDLTGMIESQGIIKPFKDRNQKVLILPGNWDSFATTDFMAQLYGVKNIHGYSAIYEHVGFFGAGGATNLPSFPGNTTEKELEETLKKAHGGLKGIEKKVMLTHMHAAGTISEFSGVEGSKAIRKAIQKFRPDFLLHGHIHEAAGMEDKIGKTKILNVDDKGVILEL